MERRCSINSNEKGGSFSDIWLPESLSRSPSPPPLPDFRRLTPVTESSSAIGSMGDRILGSSFSRLNISSNDQQPSMADYFYFAEPDNYGAYHNNYILNNVGSTGFGFGFQNGSGTRMDSMVGPGRYGFGASSSGSSDAICRDSLNWNVSLNFRDEFRDRGNDFGPYDHTTNPFLKKQLMAQGMNSNSNSSPQSRTLKRSCVNRSWLQEVESLPLLELKGSILLIAKDKNGSRILLEKLEKNLNRVEIDTVIFEVERYADELMKNQFASSFMKKLLAVCTANQRNTIFLAVTRSPAQFVTICMNDHGSKVMVKVLENISDLEQIYLVNVVLTDAAMVRLCTDSNGQYVIRHCLQNFCHVYKEYLINKIKENCLDIAIDQSGCCLVQFCMDCAHGDAKEHLMKAIIKNSLQLAQDPYGNYVVQYLLGKGIPRITSEIIRQLENNFLCLSRNKHGSHVVERFMVDCGEENARRVIMELLADPEVDRLLTDPFGNFVIQKALSVAKGQLLYALRRLIQCNASKMQSDLYGRKILTTLEKWKPRKL